MTRTLAKAWGRAATERVPGPRSNAMEEDIR